MYIEDPSERERRERGEKETVPSNGTRVEFPPRRRAHDQLVIAKHLDGLWAVFKGTSIEKAIPLNYMYTIPRPEQGYPMLEYSDGPPKNFVRFLTMLGHEVLVHRG